VFDFLRRSPAASPARTPPTASAEEAAAGLDDFIDPTAAGMVDFVSPTPADTQAVALGLGPAGYPGPAAAPARAAAASPGGARATDSAAGSSGAGAAAAGPEAEDGPGAGAGAADSGGERAPKRRRVPLVGLQARRPLSHRAQHMQALGGLRG